MVIPSAKAGGTATPGGRCVTLLGASGPDRRSAGAIALPKASEPPPFRRGCISPGGRAADCS